MGRPIEIARLELSASDLRVLAAKTGDGGWVRRLLAIALLLDSHSREAAAVANGMTRQTLRDWVHRFNADGVSGLRSRTSPGRPPALNETLMEELRSIVLEGPDPERHRVVRWRRIDLCEEIASRWSVTVCEQTMGKWLRKLGMTRLQPVRGGAADEIGLYRDWWELGGWHDLQDVGTVPEKRPLPLQRQQLITALPVRWRPL
jgi:transposase